MGLELPDWVRTTFLVVTGDGWPEADEDDLWALSHTWTQIGDVIYTLEQRIADPVRAARRTGWHGPTADVFTDAGDAFIGQGGQQLTGLAHGARELADFIYDTGTNVQYMKIVVTGELLILAAQI